jgi:hypothetical protein
MRFILVLAVLAGCRSAGPAPSSQAAPREQSTREQSTRYAVVGGDKPAAAEIVRGPRGVRASYARRDGSAAEVELSLDASSVPVRYGHGSESFAVERGVARWSNAAERGTQPWTGPAFYVPYDDENPFRAGWLARALLEAPQHRLPLLPSGAAMLEPLSSVTLSGGRTVSSYLVVGMDLEPTVVWLDGERALVAQTSGAASGLIEDALAPQLATLNAAHATAMAARRKRIAAEVTERPAGGLLIEHVRLFDPVELTVTPGTSVWVNGARIAKVGPDGTLGAPAGIKRLDGRDRFVMPGLWDNHAHLWGDVDAAMLLAAGVTTTRDMGNTEDLPRRAAQFDAGDELGPHVVMAMRVDMARENFLPGMTAVVATEADAARVVDTAASRGYAYIKVGSVAPALVPALGRLAHARGLKLIGHVPEGMTARAFIEAGADEISHAAFLVRNFFAGETRPPGETATQTSVRRAALDLTAPQVKEFAQVFAARHAAIDPTVVWTEIMNAGDGAGLAPTYDRVPFQLPVVVGRGLFQLRSDPPGEPKVLDAQLALIKFLYDHGVGLVPGTDATTGNMVGFSLHRELELYAKAGIPAAAVLRLATYGSAANAQLEKRRGRVAAGYDADLVVIDGDPSRQIGDIRKVELVVKNGALFDPARIYKALGLRRR